MPTPENLKIALQDVIDTLRSRLGNQLVALVLYGSQARGDANENSDWDILLIAHRLPEKTWERHLLLKQALPDAWRARVTILAKTPAEFTARLPALYLDIALDGVILYDTEAYADQQLKRLRALITQHGLQRQQQAREMSWRWAQFPGYPWALEWENVT